MVEVSDTAFRDRAVGALLDAPVNIVGLDLSGLNKNTREHVYAIGVVGSVALVAVGIKVVISAMRRNGNLDSDSLPGSAEMYQVREAEAEIAEVEAKTARKEARIVRWEGRMTQLEDRFPQKRSRR